MQSAAGGTSQRLKPAFAIVCSRSRIPDPAPGIVPACSIEAMCYFPLTAALVGLSAVYDPVILSSFTTCKLLPCCPAPFDMRQNREAHSKILTPDAARI